MRLLRFPLLAFSVIFLLFANSGESLPATIAAPSVTKVEPPSWWANHSINPVHLLVRGADLQGARVRSANREIVVAGVRVNERGTYLFVNLQIGLNARPGNYPLTISTDAGSAAFSFRIEAPLNAATHFQGITTEDVIYLIMTDRFSDGDSSNNSPPGSMAGVNDRRNPRAYHGGDLRGVINHLPYLKELGVTAIWLTPWYDNWNGLNTCDKPWCPNTYYHGYHAIDYYSVEDHFGGLETLKELVEKAHALGIKLIQDQVANHVGSQHPWVKEPPLVNWLHGTQENHEREKFNNSVLLSPHRNEEEFRNTLDGWFSDDLPDLNQGESEVTRYEIQNSLWWVGVTGIDGIRQDTIQYMPRTFIHDLSNALHRQYAKVWMVGEVFDFDSAHTSFFIGGHTGWDKLDTKLDSVFDFPLWSVSLEVFTNKRPVRALRDQLRYDGLYPDASRLTTMLNNHDTQRFMSLQGATLTGAMLHTAFMIAVRGTPQLYAGEEIAMEGGSDPDNRRDFPGGFPGDKSNAFAAAERTKDQQRMWEWTRDWLSLRREHQALRRGSLIDLYYDDDSYAFARRAANETVIVIVNRAGSEKKIHISALASGIGKGVSLSPLYGVKESVKTNNNGELFLVAPPKSAIAYKVDG